MAGNKNYQSYRDELARLIPFLHKYEDDTGVMGLSSMKSSVSIIVSICVCW